MTGDARRNYDGSRRRLQAARTRARIIESAQRLFVERGYTATSIPMIAAEAEVAVETVYRSASGKAGLLADAVWAAVAGAAERAEVPVVERPAIRRIIEEHDPVRQLAMYAATQPGIWSRVGPLLRVLDAAANGDPDLVSLRDRIAKQRHQGLRTGLGELLEERGVLRTGLSADRSGDIIYTLCGQANYEALVLDCGWSEQEYQDWLTRSLVAALLPEPPDRRS